MDRDDLRRACQLAGFLALLTGLVATSALCAEPTNPGIATVSVRYRSSTGRDVTAIYAVIPDGSGKGSWDPALSPWNGYNTSAGNKIAHIVVGGPGFDFTDPNTGELVTAAKCKTYWDAKVGSDWTFVSAATCETNCYAYATGRTRWIRAAGWNIIAQDEYTIWQDGYCKKDCIMKLIGDHAYKLEDCCAYVGKDYIKKASQKVEAGPVYLRTFGCPPYGKEGGGTIYCKK